MDCNARRTLLLNTTWFFVSRKSEGIDQSRGFANMGINFCGKIKATTRIKVRTSRNVACQGFFCIWSGRYDQHLEAREKEDHPKQADLDLGESNIMGSTSGRRSVPRKLIGIWERRPAPHGNTRGRRNIPCKLILIWARRRTRRSYEAEEGTSEAN